MPIQAKGNLLSDNAVRALAEGHRIRVGRLSTIEERKRRRYDGGTNLQHYVVTQTQINPVFGLGINCAVTKSFSAGSTNLGEGWFLAKPYERGISTLEDLPGEEVKVYTRFIHGAICTGHRFIMCPRLEGGREDDDVVGDVVQGPNGYQWYGNWIASTSTSMCEVAYRPDIPMYQSYRGVFDLSLIGGAHAFKVSAANGTGETLFDGQQVILNLTEFGWRVSEYSCRGG